MTYRETTVKKSQTSVTILRIVANMLDNILLSLLTLFIVIILTFTSFDILHLDNFKEMLSVDPYSLESIENQSHQPYELFQSMVFFVSSLSILYAFLSFIYFQILFTTEKQATFGMQLFKLRLVTLDDSELTGNKVMGRTLMFIVFKMIYVGGLSLITMAASKNNQTLHDMPVGTTIIVQK